MYGTSCSYPDLSLSQKLHAPKTNLDGGEGRRITDRRCFQLIFFLLVEHCVPFVSWWLAPLFFLNRHFVIKHDVVHVCWISEIIIKIIEGKIWYYSSTLQTVIKWGGAISEIQISFSALSIMIKNPKKSLKLSFYFHAMFGLTYIFSLKFPPTTFNRE